MVQLSLDDIRIQRETSIEALKEVRDSLCYRRRQVLECIMNNPQGVTRQEISEEIDLPINVVTPRVCELLEKGIIAQDFEKRPCKITKKKAYILRPILKNDY